MKETCELCGETVPITQARQDRTGSIICSWCFCIIYGTYQEKERLQYLLRSQGNKPVLHEVVESDLQDSPDPYRLGSPPRFASQVRKD